MMVVGLWLTPFYIRTLGAEGFGIWLVGLQVLTFLLLCDFGIIAVTARDVARASGLEQSQPGCNQLGILIGQTIKVVLFQTILIALVALGLFLFRPSGTPALRGPIAIVLLAFVLSYPLRIFPVVLQGLQDLKFLGELRLCLWAFATAVGVVLLFLGARYYALVAAWCLQQIGHDLGAFLRMRRIRPDLLSAEVWNQAGRVQARWFTRGFWVSVGQGAMWLLIGTDLLIIARWFGPATVVIYASTGKLITVLQNQPQTLAGVALPGLSHMKTSEPRERILQATTSLTQAMLLLTGAVFCLVLAVNQQFIGLWLGPRFFGGMKLTGLLLLNFLFRQIDYTLAIALFALGYEKLTAIRCLLDGLFSVGLALLLVGPWGLEGVAMGFLCGVLFVALPIDSFLLMREFHTSALQLIRPYAPFLWRFALIGAFGLAVGAWIGTPNPINVALLILATGLAYVLVFAPYVWRSPLRGYIQSVVSMLTAGMRSRIPGWSNNA
jgi:O-antigen/teichoic acid export membrane protein